MTAITVELSADTYRKLQEQAQRIGKVPELVVSEWLSELLAKVPTPLSERERAREALRAVGLLVEFSAEEQAHAKAAVTLTLDEVRAALDRAGGKPLSEIILDMRGPKE
ncbi:MAG: hypothetical protein WCJ55_10085 [Chloroflexales bacterium]